MNIQEPIAWNVNKDIHSLAIFAKIHQRDVVKLDQVMEYAINVNRDTNVLDSDAFNRSISPNDAMF